MQILASACAIDPQPEAVLLGHQNLKASLQILDPASVLAALAFGRGRLGLASTRQLTAYVGNLGAYGFFALDQIVPIQSATSGRSRVSASTSVSASAWSL